ncbi:MAG: potassium channel family protein [Nitriliruptoraceae bacterium]
MEPTTERGPRLGYPLLLALLVLVIGLALALSARPDGIVVAVSVQAVTVTVALHVTGAPRHLRRSVAIALAVIVLVLVLVSSPATPASPELSLRLSRMVGLGLSLAIPYRIARDIARSTHITLGTVAAGLCVYLLLGLAFGYVHVLVAGALPDAYSTPLTDQDAMYLSFVTLTTVGFGDVVPITGPARAVTIIEGVVGQLYLVSIVALLVGNLGRERRG